MEMQGLTKEEGTDTPKLLGHDLRKSDYRSEDVLLEGDDADADFQQLGLSNQVTRGLAFEGFEKPSPIQLRAIPIGLTGIDLLMKSKSGTGKTCVFSVIALENTVVSLNKIQVLMIAPCREIAVQTQFVVKSIGAFKEGLQVGLFIGGCALICNIQNLSSCHIAVGTPGRVVHMIQEFGMDLSGVKLFVMDEADKLFEEAFMSDLEVILGTLPKTAQIIAASATFENGVESKIAAVMKDPVRVRAGVGGVSLLGVDQYAMDVCQVFNFQTEEGQTLKMEDVFQLKLKGILNLLSLIPFGQAVVFTEYQLKAERIYDTLRKEGVDAVLLSGALCQSLRLDSFHKFQKEKVQILVATDVGARGLDYELVNLVINYECPKDLATYVHRMGRSGRFGSCGRVITLLGYPSDLSSLTTFQAKLKANIDLIYSLDDIHTVANTPVPNHEDLPTSSKKLTPIKLPTGGTILSLSEAVEYLRIGGPEAFEFAAFYCACPFQEQTDAFSSERLRQKIDEFLTKEGSGPIFQEKVETVVASNQVGETEKITTETDENTTENDCNNEDALYKEAEDFEELEISSLAVNDECLLSLACDI